MGEGPGRAERRSHGVVVPFVEGSGCFEHRRRVEPARVEQRAGRPATTVYGRQEVHRGGALPTIGGHLLRQLTELNEG